MSPLVLPTTPRLAPAIVAYVFCEVTPDEELLDEELFPPDEPMEEEPLEEPLFEPEEDDEPDEPPLEEDELLDVELCPPELLLEDEEEEELEPPLLEDDEPDEPPDVGTRDAGTMIWEVRPQGSLRLNGTPGTTAPRQMTAP
jgi:hypothetical protein